MYPDAEQCNDNNRITIFMVTYSSAASEYGNVSIKLNNGQNENAYTN